MRLGLCVVVVGVVCVLALGVAPAAAATPDVRPGRRPTVTPVPVIQWSPRMLKLELTAGEVREATVSFSASARIQSAGLRVLPVGSFISASPTSWDSIEAGVTQTITVRVAAPATISRPSVELAGAIYVTRAGVPLGAPLSVKVMVRTPPTPRVRPAVAWTPSVITATITAGTTYETDVTFTSTVPLSVASLILVPDRPGLVEAALVQVPTESGGVGRVHLTVTAPQGLRGRSINATVSIRDGARVLPAPLHVRVQVEASQPAPAATSTPGGSSNRRVPPKK